MLQSPPAALAAAAETRRREMPAAIALVILIGGIAAAITGGVGAVGWAAIMSLLLIFDAELYRRLDAANAKLDGPVMAGLVAWAFFGSVFYVALPIALWLSGEAAGAAAAMVLWVAGVVRHFSPGASGALPIALAGAAPPAFSLLVSPLLLAAASARPDWDLAVIAAIGGGALMAYVTQARVSAAYAEQVLREAMRTENLRHTLAELMLDQGPLAATLIDTQGCVVAASKAVREALERFPKSVPRFSDENRSNYICRPVPDCLGSSPGQSGTGLGANAPVGRKFEELLSWPPERWREAFARALAGEQVSCDDDETRTANAATWSCWEVRPWRNADGEICGVIAYGRDSTSLLRMRAAAAASNPQFNLTADAGRLVPPLHLKTA